MRWLLLAVLLVSCTDDDRSRKVLEDQGYTKVEITGYGAFSCSEDDTYATEFRALTPANHQVEGVVCCGVLKGCTIRLK